MVGTESRVTVATECTGDHVAVVVAVEYATEIRCCGVVAVVGAEGALFLVAAGSVVESEHIGGGDVAGVDVVAPVLVVLSFLNESNSKAVDVGDCAVPDKGVVEVPVEVLWSCYG